MNQKDILDNLKFNATQRHRLRSNKFNHLHQNYNTLEGYVPISGGNAFTIAEYINLYRNQDSLTYKIYLLEERYWTELWKIKRGSCPPLERIWKSVMVIAWNYGQVAIKQISDKYVALGLVAADLDINQDIIKGEGFINNISFIGTSKVNKQKIDLNGNNSIMGKFNYRGVPAVWLYLPFCFEIKKHFISYQNNLIFNTKKIKYTVKNEDVEAINEELSSIFNLENNVIFQIGTENAGGGVGNEIEILDKKGDNLSVLNDLNGYIKRWYYMFGRRYSYESEKKERMITNEFAQDELNYVLIENEIESELQKIVSKFNKAFNFKAELEKVVELVKIKEAKTEEFIAHGNQNQQE